MFVEQRPVTIVTVTIVTVTMVTVTIVTGTMVTVTIVTVTMVTVTLILSSFLDINSRICQIMYTTTDYCAVPQLVS